MRYISQMPRMALPSLQGEGQGWGLKPPQSDSRSFGAEIILTPPLPLPYKGGERLARRVAYAELAKQEIMN